MMNVLLIIYVGAGRRARLRDGPLGAGDAHSRVRRAPSHDREPHRSAGAACRSGIGARRAVRAWRPGRWHGAGAASSRFVVAIGIGEAQAARRRSRRSSRRSWKWTPLLAQGFALNIAISFLAMAIGTAVGVLLGLAQISLLPPVRGVVVVRDAVLPQRAVAGAAVLLHAAAAVRGARSAARSCRCPDWLKATLGLSLPVMANVSEIVRGAVQSIPTAQWEVGRVARVHRAARRCG